MTYRELLLHTLPKDMQLPDVLARKSEWIRVPNVSTLLNLGAMGLAGETGEVADLLKKVLFHDRPLDYEELVKELGDVRWYLECLCYALGTTIDQVEQANMQKLLKRYPKGYSHEAAKARVDVQHDESCSSNVGCNCS